MRQRVLLDTHILIHSISDKERLSRKVESILGDYDNELYLSSESLREIRELWQVGKVDVKEWESATDIIDYIKNKTPVVVKYAKEEHFRTYFELPWFEDHKDPRDRMIIAHAITEKLTLISGDAKFSKYERYGLDWIQNKRK
jgi:PIN domain nuclease of toxin-antitoxin system